MLKFVYILREAVCVRCSKLTGITAIFLPYAPPEIAAKRSMFPFSLVMLRYVWVSEKWILARRRVYFRQKIMTDHCSFSILQKKSHVWEHLHFGTHWDAICTIWWSDEKSSLYLNRKRIKRSSYIPGFIITFFVLGKKISFEFPHWLISYHLVIRHLLWSFPVPSMGNLLVT